MKSVCGHNRQLLGVEGIARIRCRQRVVYAYAYGEDYCTRLAKVHHCTVLYFCWWCTVRSRILHSLSRLASRTALRPTARSYTRLDASDVERQPSARDTPGPLLLSCSALGTGGAIDVEGNVACSSSPASDGSAEWNFFWDPKAAKRVRANPPQAWSRVLPKGPVQRARTSTLGPPQITVAVSTGLRDCFATTSWYLFNGSSVPTDQAPQSVSEGERNFCFRRLCSWGDVPDELVFSRIAHRCHVCSRACMVSGALPPIPHSAD